MTKSLLPIIAAAAIVVGIATTADAQVNLNPGSIYPTFPVTIYANGPCDGTDRSVLFPFAQFGLTVGNTGAVSIADAGATIWFDGAPTPYTTQYANVAVGRNSVTDDHVIMFVDPTTRQSSRSFPSGFAPEFEPDDHVAFHVSCLPAAGGWQALVQLDFVDNADH